MHILVRLRLSASVSSLVDLPVQVSPTLAGVVRWLQREGSIINTGAAPIITTSELTIRCAYINR